MKESQPISNPMRTDGFEFVEYAAPEPELLRRLFESMGLPAVARHRSKNVTLHRQGDINFIINAESDSFAQGFARAHGPCACAMAFRVADARFAFERALELGAKPGPVTAGPMELNIPSIVGIGGSLIYLVDRYGERTIYDVDFVPPPPSPPPLAGEGWGGDSRSGLCRGLAPSLTLPRKRERGRKVADLRTRPCSKRPTVAPGRC
jgi:4-hydroxyphenylpyruvate dioxygenase-like putative hemolysin